MSAIVNACEHVRVCKPHTAICQLGLQCGDLQVCVRIVKLREAIGGLQVDRGTLCCAHTAVLQGCGNVLLGSVTLTCAAGRWHRQCASWAAAPVRSRSAPRPTQWGFLQGGGVGTQKEEGKKYRMTNVLSKLPPPSKTTKMKKSVCWRFCTALTRPCALPSIQTCTKCLLSYN